MTEPALGQLPPMHSVGGFGLMLGLIGFAMVAIWWSVVGIYFGAFECSRFGATPGKMLCGLIVVDLEGNRISFWRAMFLSQWSGAAVRRGSSPARRSTHRI
jgi:uncharacterized RDD family membrane protein YckC